ncbi:MAG TPA: methyltransferase domain-containing protein [Candidatus Thermoplasmatota archaeon]|nr:methyltransferase domain-containing protein [Candidatus Thermoplasmatota archaeon]
MAWPTLRTFAFRPREALMWIPRASDVARIAAACRAAGPRVVDVGAGTGLLARLLADAGVRVEASDPAPASPSFAPVARGAADGLPSPVDAAIVSWMEAGKDYREAVARAARVVVNAYDVEGGCGVAGAVDFAPYGFVEAASWRAASFEDAAFALERPGRGLRRKGWPGSRVDVLTREPALRDALARAVAEARAGDPYPWEAEMERAGL